MGSNNRKLIYKLVQEMKDKGYKRMYVYNEYVDKAEFYCKKDLEIMRQMLAFERDWVLFRGRDLAKSSKWVENEE